MTDPTTYQVAITEKERQLIMEALTAKHFGADFDATKMQLLLNTIRKFGLLLEAKRGT